MNASLIIFFVLLTSSLWGMEIVNQSDGVHNQVDKNWFITALNYRMSSPDPIVLCFQKVIDDISEIATLKTVRKGIQAVANKADILVMTSPLSQLSGRGLNSEVKKAYADEINNGWIALCSGTPYANGGLLTVQKYCLSSQKWEFGQEVHCAFPQDCTYSDLEKSDMVVINIPDGDCYDSIDSCFALIRSLHAKRIPLLVNSDRKLLRSLWKNLSDLLEDVQVFSNIPLCDTDSCDTDSNDEGETLSGRQSELDDIFDYSDDTYAAKETSSEQDGENKQFEQEKDQKSLEDTPTQTFSDGAQKEIKSGLENKKQGSYVSALPNLLKNPWVVSGASVVLIGCLYYYKFVR